MDFILWCLNIAWKVLVVIIGFMLLKYIISNGSDTFHDILDTISTILQTVGHVIRKVCLHYLKKEESKATTDENVEEDESAVEPDEDDSVTVTIGDKVIQYENFEEFREAIVNKKHFAL